MGLFGFLFGCSKKPSPDEWVLDQLRQVGDDLSVPHSLEFQLRFSTKTAAEQAASRIKTSGFEVAVKTDTLDNSWLCVPTKTMVPELSELEKIHTAFAAVAAEFGGRYEGWSTVAEKEE